MYGLQSVLGQSFKCFLSISIIMKNKVLRNYPIEVGAKFTDDLLLGTNKRNTRDQQLKTHGMKKIVDCF